MKVMHQQVVTIAAICLAALAWAWFDHGDVSAPALVIAAAVVPLAALFYTSGRLGLEPPLAALIGGGTIGIVIAVAGHAVVFAFAFTFFLGFAEEATTLLDQLRLDPRLTSALSSPWTVLLLIELAVVAPLSEEVGKALGGRLFRFTDRRSAFNAGVAAGVGFAVVENIAYGLWGTFLGTPWEPIVMGRMMGAAVHPLASGLVMMGWWEWRNDRDLGRLAARFFSGIGIHALWNGSIVVLGIAASAFDTETTFSTHTLISLAYTAALGLVAAGALWRVTTAVAEGKAKLLMIDSTDTRVVAAWVVLASSLIAPMAVLILAYPDFVGS